MASLRRSRAMASRSCVACWRGGRAGQQHRAAQRGAHLQHGLGDVDLVVVQVARQALEVAQHLEAGDAQAAGRTACTAASSPSGWPTMSRADSITWRSRPRAWPQLGLQRPGQRDGVHAEVVDVAGRGVHGHGSGLPRTWCTSSNITPPSGSGGERAAVLRVQPAGLDEVHAALAQRGHGRGHVGRAQATRCSILARRPPRPCPARARSAAGRSCGQGLRRMRPLGRMPKRCSSGSAVKPNSSR
jgi:hypothetical protein